MKTAKPVRPEDEDDKEFKTPRQANAGPGPFQWPSECIGLWCVSVRVSKDGASVRDTKDPTKHTLKFDAGEWDAFLTAVKAGQYDLPKA